MLISGNVSTDYIYNNIKELLFRCDKCSVVLLRIIFKTYRAIKIISGIFFKITLGKILWEVKESECEYR